MDVFSFAVFFLSVGKGGGADFLSFSLSRSRFCLLTPYQVAYQVPVGEGEEARERIHAPVWSSDFLKGKEKATELFFTRERERLRR